MKHFRILILLLLSSSALADTPPLKNDPFGTPGGNTSYLYLLGLINALTAKVNAGGGGGGGIPITAIVEENGPAIVEENGPFIVEE